jgi:YegS/Rv2252/BmrU family lipid kinase
LTPIPGSIFALALIGGFFGWNKRMRQRIKLIANPVSGGDARSAIRQAVQVLEAAGARVDLYLTGARGDAKAEAADFNLAETDLVIAAGGDGTLNEVANGLAGRGIPLAFLPLGTANVMAHEMGIPVNLVAACRIALEGQARAVSLAEVAGYKFLMMAGIGFDAAAVKAVNSRLKRVTGKFAYLVAGLQSFLCFRPQPFILQTAAGDKIQAWHAIISNIRYYGGRFVMAPQAQLEHPALVACVVDQPGRLQLLLFWLRILLQGRLVGGVRRIESTRFSIAGGVAPVQIDGDEFEDPFMAVRCLVGQLELVFPKQQDAKD